ncbi:TonB-dependent receptor plug domain-containing protein [Cesiribacter andamanensis]|uniref:Colicin I receptor n=1 Tax=Cesiribacter andamanensis AMV16 TaxID=1279009 RepID=M7NUT9_9BACT|nr:TonB-dependent receptor plug domain-containing protein [Cesiribacter andamanensis]EMR02224.1 Colicin I receptor precursor [Cesiribacter andamanensis AMV16]
MKHTFQMLLLAACATLPMAARGQVPADSAMLELQNLSAYEQASALQAHLNDKMGVGSHIGLSSRETPGIVSVITANEIRSIGARDFIDIMRLVPGFDFASDVELAVGPTIRGNWAMEGKMLLMVDGVKYNELLFQALFFGNHLPVDQIERVEVIRGPGSAMYGGTAEYGVINITTKGAAGLNGLSANATYSRYSQDLARRSLGLSIGKQLGDVRLDFTGHTGHGNSSDRMYAPLFDALAGEVNMAGGRGQTQPTFISTGLQWKGVKARFVYDDYQWASYHYDLRNKMLNGLLSYEAKIGKRLTLTPELSYTQQVPWSYQTLIFDEEAYDVDYKISAQRSTAGLRAGYRASHRLYLTGGVEWYDERARDLLDTQNFGDVERVAYQNFGAFGEVLLKHRIANITAGMRMDHHSAFGGAMAPRFALTKHVNRWHFKGLASGAYRAPGIENINLSEDLKPERTTTFELETGYQFTKDMLLSANLFKIATRDVIVYSYNGQGEQAYENFDYVGSRGLEVVYQIRKNRWFANLSYSYSQASDKNSVETYKVAGRDHLNIGIAAHKATLHGGLQLKQHLSLNPSLVRIGERWGYAALDEEEMPILQRFAPLHLLNLQLHYKDLLPGLSLGLGVHNLLDEENNFIQAYNGDSAPVPGPGREFTLKASYDLNFKK